MLLKKQTVWLLTMLSLVVVLSVYYITSPEQKSNDITAAGQKSQGQMNKAKNISKQTGAKSSSADSNAVVTAASGNDDFDAIRMQLEDDRSKQIDELQSEIASTDLPADKRSDAYDQMQKLNETAQKEEMLETLIKTMGYDDALVQADGSKVNITVKSKKQHSPSAANDIIQLVKKEIGETNYVAVEFQPSK